MSTDQNARVSPIAPPMLSPDKKWVWDGTQWQPVADAGDPAHRSVFSAFNNVTQNLPVPVADARPIPGPPPMTVAAPVPLGVTRPKRLKAPRRPNLQLWERAPTGLNKYLYYVAGGVAVLIVIVIALQFVGNVSLPNRDTGGAQPAPTGGPPPLKDRSEAGRADRYVNRILFPALGNINDSIRPVQQGCSVSMTVSCAAAVPEAERDFKSVASTMDANASLVPACIAPGVANVKHDVLSLEQFLAAAQTASDNNQLSLVASDLAGWRRYLKVLGKDEHTVTAIEMPTCDPTLTGPAA